MSDDINKMLKSFKSMEEIKLYADAQYSTIITLNNKIQKLQTEKEELKKLLEERTPLLIHDENNKLVNTFDVSDEEVIAITQIRRLKNISMERDFTKEESSIFDIMNKNLIAIRNAPKTLKIESKELTERELLALIEKSSE